MISSELNLLNFVSDVDVLEGNGVWGRLADAISSVVWLGDHDCTTSVSVWKTVEEDVDFFK